MNYNSYGEWFDNGPGSESFKRSLQSFTQSGNACFDGLDLNILEAIYKILIEKSEEKPKKDIIELPEELFEI